jgi:hypothetical protein
MTVCRTVSEDATGVGAEHYLHVVGHEIDPIDVLMHLVDLKPAKVPVRCRCRKREAEVRSRRLEIHAYVL